MHDTMISAAHLSPIQKLGTRVEGTFTAEQAMIEGKLGGWNVRKEPLVTASGIAVPGRVALIRDNPHHGGIDVLGTAGPNYQVIQNEEHAGVLNDLVDESGANFELAGSVDDGRRVFLSMKLPDHVSIGGIDPVNNSILALNSHDNSMSFTLMVTAVRHACGNVLNVPYKGQSHVIRVRHTSGAHKALQLNARKALDITFNYLDAFQAEAERLINTTMTEDAFEQIVRAEFGAPEDAPAATRTRSENKIGELMWLFTEAETQANIRGTAWAGFNAMTEWADHFAPTNGGENADINRSTKAILNPYMKERALALMGA